MPLKTRRAKDTAEVMIDYALCNGCGLCAEVCKGQPLYVNNGQVKIDQRRLFGCIGCGHCAAICPQSCIVVQGRELSPEDLFELPGREARADYASLLAMLQARRSCRAFRNREVEPEVVQRILEAAATAPMGLPPSEVEVLVLDGFARVREFARDAVDLMYAKRWLFSPIALALLRPFIGKEAYALWKSFLAPLPSFFHEKMEQNEDWLLYGAPLAMYFHASPTSDPMDFAIAGTYAMLAAEASGLGTCMIGTLEPFLKHKSRLNQKYNLPANNVHGIMVIIGYPKYTFLRGIRRSLARVDWIKR